MFHRILVALDKSQMSQYVFDEAVYLAQATGAEMLLLSVLSAFEQPGLALGLHTDSIYQVSTETIDYYIRHWEDVKEKGIEYLTVLKNQAIAKGITADLTQEVGDPTRIICDIAHSWEADLIVMGRRGLSGLSEFFLGSVSSYVLHHAPCSVLITEGKIPKNTEAVEEKQATTV
jgi:nucleotide-binding universal stress UspA family protein